MSLKAAIGVALVVPGMITDDPIVASRWLKIGAAVILLGVVLVFAGRALGI